MSALAADLAFDFTFPSPTTTPPPQDCHGMFSDGAQSLVFNSSLLELPYSRRHARSSSKASSIYSAVSTVESNADSVCTHLTTPPRTSPPIHQHGPALLPKIRFQDQEIASSGSAAPRASYTHMAPMSHAAPMPSYAAHARSFTNPETLSNMAFAHMSSFDGYPPATTELISDDDDSASVAPLLYSPASFAQNDMPYRRSSIACVVDAFPTTESQSFTDYRQMSLVPSSVPSTRSSPDFIFPPCIRRSVSPLSVSDTPGQSSSSVPSMTLMTFLTAPNPAASLVRTISFPLRDPNTKHFWWDIRNICPWGSFNMAAVLALPGASALLHTPVPGPLLPHHTMVNRHPETEYSLHRIYSSYYIPKLNSALAISSSQPLQFSVPSKPSSGLKDLLFVVNAVGESVSAAVMFGGKPTARIVGIVRGFDRFNTGMRVEGNIKRVEYLRGLAAIHHAMREHGCRYGFILTEIELVVVRNGIETIPVFGDLEITSIPLTDASTHCSAPKSPSEPPITACLALWALCQMAGNNTLDGQAHWKAEIGAPAEGTRRKARPRDSWIPQPQLAEKREAKRSRGWVWPEDAIGRKELGKRGVKYGGV